jgi:hypothetical protein
MPTSFAHEIASDTSPDDVEAVAEAIELVDVHSSKHYAKAAITTLIERGWIPPMQTGD